MIVILWLSQKRLDAYCVSGNMLGDGDTVGNKTICALKDIQP